MIKANKISKSNIIKSARNIPNLKIIEQEGTNVYDLLKYKNVIFTNPYTGENAIPDKAISSSFNITRSGLETVSSSYVKIGEIMFFNLGGEEMSVVFSNIGDKNGSDKKEWVIIPAPSNF